MIRVCVAARSTVVRAGLEAIIGSRQDMTVVGSVASLRDAIEEEDQEGPRPEVILCVPDEETDLPAPVGLPPLVLLADRDAVPPRVALRGNVRAILPLEAPPDTILAAVEAVAAGLVAVPAEHVDDLLAERQASQSDGPALSSREIEVLRMLADGLGNKMIAHRLSVSEHTVKFHISSIFAKLGAGTRTEAVTEGLRRGWIYL